MASILLIVAVAISAVLLVLLWKYSYWYRRGVPQGNPFKLWGDLNDVTITFIPFWQHYLKLGRKFGDKPFYGDYSVGRPRLLIRDSEMLKDILTRKFSSFSENGFAMSEEVEPILVRDPFFQKGGEKWKESRANFSSLMSLGRLRNSMLPEIVTVADEAAHYLKELKHESGQGDGTNVKDLSMRYMTNILSRVTFSLDAGSFKPDKGPFLQQAENIFSSRISSLFANILLIVAPTLVTSLGQSFISKDVIEFFGSVLEKQKRYRIENKLERDDILNITMKKASELNKSDKKPVDADFEALCMVIVFFVEGFETTATTMSAVMASLAEHEDIQDNMRGEILKACPQGKEITEEAINSMPLLRNYILETLRIYPPGLMLQRIVTENVTLQAKSGDEIHLKQGEYINIPIASIQRDPEFFPDPDVFDPGRFEDEIQKRNNLAFGDGPRQCPGQRFASFAIRVMIAMVLREFKLELSPKTKYPLEPINNPIIFSLKDVRVRFVAL